MPVSIVWFRQDLRIGDNPALTAATKRGKIVPVYVWDDTRTGYAMPGSASRWWLHHSLAALQESLGSLVLLRGDPHEQLDRLIAETGADAVYWNRCYEPHAFARDKVIKQHLKARGIDVGSFNASLLHEPWELQTGSGGPYKVFTPFWRTLQKLEKPEPLAKPDNIAIAPAPPGERLDDWQLQPRNPDWAQDWPDLWSPGEAGAHERLRAFVATGLAGYSGLRDFPSERVTSRLSPHLHFGEISPRQIWRHLSFKVAGSPELEEAARKFLSELAWREFSYHLLYHFPDLPEKNWKPQFDAFPWRDAPEDLLAWHQGRTGYPLVDAGMRELWATGTMHNRVRMVTASFLIKHLRIDWRKGQCWFWDTLVDADLANNAASWQWVAGSGADAAPFFRIFNPVMQGEKFDPDGTYIRRWCPELAKLDNRYIHTPWSAPSDMLRQAGVQLGVSWPHPIVDHTQARASALAAYDQTKHD